MRAKIKKIPSFPFFIFDNKGIIPEKTPVIRIKKNSLAFINEKGFRFILMITSNESESP